MQIKLEEIAGGALQEKFEKAFEHIIRNLQDPNTSFKVKRSINMKLSFTQDEDRSNVTCDLEVTEKLAPQKGLSTKFYTGTDLRTGELFIEEAGGQCRGQMSLSEFNVQPDEKTMVDEETGEIIEPGKSNVVLYQAKTV